MQPSTCVYRLYNRFYGICCSFFCTLEVILFQSEVPLQKYRRKCVFTSFETSFTAYSVLFLALWRFFYVDQRYFCQHTGINMCSLALKPVLRHLPFFFQDLGSIFASIGGSVSKIQMKTYVRQLWTRFDSIFRSLFSTLDVYLR